MKQNFSQDTIVAVSTPAGEGGIGIVRLSGRDALKITDRMFSSPDKKKPSRLKTHTIHYGYIAEGGKRIVDEVLLTVMKAPRTYTREDVAEINCHGGAVAVRKVAELAVKKGARVAEPGEFTKRAFLNGRLDLAQAEAVVDIIKARTDAGLRASMDQLGGALSQEIRSVRREVLDISADIEATIDFPEEDIGSDARIGWIKRIRKARKGLEGLADTYNRGAIIKNGVTAVIAGRANVGKSSLMNLLLKRDRVIVTRIPGTTRDAIEELVNIKGMPIRLVDTAGIRRKRCAIEKEGIRISRSYLSRADLAVCVLDGSERLKRDDEELLRSAREKCAVIAVNKCDLKPALDIDEVKRISKNKKVIRISCLRRKGIDRLEAEVYNKALGGRIDSSHRLMLNNIRHKTAVEKAAASLLRAEQAARRKSSAELLAVDIRESVTILGEITGETYTDDILNIVFSRFCIGK